MNCYFSLKTDMLGKIQSSACLLYVHLFTLGYPDCIPHILSSYLALRIIELVLFSAFQFSSEMAVRLDWFL